MRTSIEVQNLKCGGCAKTITNKLSELQGINEVTVDADASLVSFTSENTDGTLLAKQALKSLGYPSVEDNNTMVSKAKSFVSCATGKMSS